MRSDRRDAIGPLLLALFGEFSSELGSGSCQSLSLSASRPELRDAVSSQPPRLWTICNILPSKFEPGILNTP